MDFRGTSTGFSGTGAGEGTKAEADHPAAG
jgi:hypothetical protein